MREIMRLCLHRSSRLLILYMFLVTTAVAQHGKEIIHITTATTDITGLAKNISAQTGLKYSLNMQNASLKKKITIRPGNYPLSEVLEQIKKQAALQYKILGTHILFIDYSAGGNGSKSKSAPGTMQTPEAGPKSATAPKFLQTAKSAFAPKKAVSAPKPGAAHRQAKPLTPKRATRPAARQMRVVPAAAAKIDALPAENRVVLTAADTLVPVTPLMIAAQTDGLASFLRARLRTADTAKALPGAGKPATATTKNKWLQPVLKAGLTADELFYSGAHVQAGLQWLYGIAAYGTNFKNGQFRWGAGLSLPVTANGRIHVSFTTGSSSAAYERDTIYLRSVEEKERLHRLGIAWSRNLNSRLSMQVQLHYNLLHQSFAATDTSSSANPFIDNFDERYRVFKPPYTIAKSLGSNTADKSWLGLQLTLFFRFL